VILLDANVILLDTRYQRDVNYPTNRSALSALAASGLALGITAQALYEVVGVMSFQMPHRLILDLPSDLQTRYSLNIVPNPERITDYAGCTYAEVLWQLAEQMALGDAVQVVQIRKFG
jgi:hypothetical protein